MGYLRPAPQWTGLFAFRAGLHSESMFKHRIFTFRAWTSRCFIRL